MKGVIADDLSGAAEIGGMAWRYGLNAEIASIGRLSSDADLVCIDTDSRSVAAAEAGRLAALAAELLQRAGIKWIYKKVDSVLRGHVVTELEAILQQLDQQSALIVPANPTRGRIVRNGQYWIGEKPIHETEFGLDPEHPRLSSSVFELLGRSSSVVSQTCTDSWRIPSPGIVLGEAGSDEDLRCWAERRSEFDLVGGAVEFFRALLEAEGLAPVKRADLGATEAPTTRELFVCGSVSQSTKRFVASAQRGGVPVLRVPEPWLQQPEVQPSGEDEFVKRAVTESSRHRRIVLTTPDRVVGDPMISRRASRRLTRVASAILRKTGIARVYVDGGSTAALLLNSMGWRNPKIVKEWAPGVVTVDVRDTRGTLLTLKPGSYVWPDVVQEDVAGGDEVRRAAG